MHMHHFEKATEDAVLNALKRYSEYQVARMYGLRVASVRLIRQTALERQCNRTDTLRQQESPLQMGLRLHEDVFNTYLLQQRTGMRVEIPKQDYAGLEGRVMAGFFTPDGLPTPAFWGFISQYVKKSGHTMLDILHDKEIYAPEQLERALDIDSQIQDMTQAQRIALLRRLTNAVYSDEFKDPTDPGSDVQDSE